MKKITPPYSFLLTLFFILYSCIFQTANVYAGGVLVFGPEKFVRKSTGPETDPKQFQINNTTYDSSIEIINGDDNIDSMVTSARVWINGDLVAEPKDFKKHVAIITKLIVLKNDNILEVELEGKPGSFITINIYGNSVLPPINNPPTANSGADQQTNEGAVVTLNGSASSDPDGNPIFYSWA